MNDLCTPIINESGSFTGAALRPSTKSDTRRTPCPATVCVHPGTRRSRRSMCSPVRPLTLGKAEGLFKVKVVPFGSKCRRYLPEKAKPFSTAYHPVAQNPLTRILSTV